MVARDDWSSGSVEHGTMQKVNWGAQDMPIYTHGTGNLDGSRHDTGPNAGLSSANKPLSVNAFVQSDSLGYPLRMDAAAAQYHLHDGLKFPSGDGEERALYDLGMHKIRQDHSQTLQPGMCKTLCDTDPTCKAFAESRWQLLKTGPKCATYHSSYWVTETAMVAQLVPTTSWDFYAKYTQPKNPTYLHAEMNKGFSPTSTGRRLEGVY
jgi:hypothetical protein